MLSNNGLCLCVASDRFQIFTELHALTQATHSYALLFPYIGPLCTCVAPLQIKAVPVQVSFLIYYVQLA